MIMAFQIATDNADFVKINNAKALLKASKDDLEVAPGTLRTCCKCLSRIPMGFLVSPAPFRGNFDDNLPMSTSMGWKSSTNVDPKREVPLFLSRSSDHVKITDALDI